MKRIVISIQKMLVMAFCSLFVSIPTYAASGVDSCNECTSEWTQFVQCYQSGTEVYTTCLDLLEHDSLTRMFNDNSARMKEYAENWESAAYICTSVLNEMLGKDICVCKNKGQLAQVNDDGLTCMNCHNSWNCDGTTTVNGCSSGYSSSTVSNNHYCCDAYSNVSSGSAYLQRTCYNIDGSSFEQYNCDYNKNFYAPNGESTISCSGTTCSGCTSCNVAGVGPGATTYNYIDTGNAGHVAYVKKFFSNVSSVIYTTVGKCTSSIESYVCDAGYYKSGTTITASSGCSQCPQIGSNTLSSYGATIVSGVDYSSNDASLGTSPDNHTGGIDSCYASSGSNNAKFIDSIGTFYWKSQTCNYGPKQ